MRTLPQAPRSRVGPPGAGFTLAELLVSVAVTAIVMVSVFATLTYTVSARDEVHNLAESHNAGPAILDRVEEDLRHLWIYDLPAGAVFLGRDLSVAGAQADSLDFVASAEASVPVYDGDRALRSRLVEVGWHVRANPGNPDFLELWRREDFFVDDLAFEGGDWQLVYDRMKYFNVTYFAGLGPDAEPVEEWASEAAGKMPKRIVIDLAVETQPRLDRGELGGKRMNAPRVVEFRRQILLSKDFDRMLTARLRPEIPSAPQPAGNSMLSGGGAAGGRGGDRRGTDPGSGRGGFTAGGRPGGPSPSAGAAGGGGGHAPPGPAVPFPFPFPGGGGGSPFPIPH